MVAGLLLQRFIFSSGSGRYDGTAFVPRRCDCPTCAHVEGEGLGFQFTITRHARQFAESGLIENGVARRSQVARSMMNLAWDDECHGSQVRESPEVSG